MDRRSNHHSRAAQIACGLASATLALTGLPLFADEAVNGFTEGYYAHNIVTTFQRTGAHGSNVYDNSSIEMSGLDLIRYVNHTCYRPTEFDMIGCREEFGPYANLQTTLTSGRLSTILKQYSYLAGAQKFVPAPEPVARIQGAPVTPEVWKESPKDTTKLSDAEKHQLRIRERSAELWNICREKNPTDRREMVRCHQRNIRMTTVRTENLQENVF